MAKSKSVYICSECGQEYPKWSGRCNACGAWNTLEETLIQPKSHGLAKSTGGGRLPLSSINNLSFSDETRYKTGMSELDRVLGGGLVKGSLVLLGGDRVSANRHFFYRYAAVLRRIRLCCTYPARKANVR